MALDRGAVEKFHRSIEEIVMHLKNDEMKQDKGRAARALGNSSRNVDLRIIG